jgi:hypothetical protein
MGHQNKRVKENISLLIGMMVRDPGLGCHHGTISALVDSGRSYNNPSYGFFMGQTP